VGQLGANAHGEILEAGRVPDCYLGLLLDPAEDAEAAGVLVVAPAALLHPVVPHPDGTVLYELVTGHPDRTPQELVFLVGIGTLSLVIGPVTWLAEGGSLSDAVAAADLGSVLFAASRVVHLGAVIAALVLMFTPAAYAHIKATTRAPAWRETRQDKNGGAAR
jgi:hypothetical protein